MVGMFTGHRPQKLLRGFFGDHQHVKDWLYDKIKMLHETQGVDEWIWGGALGADQWGCEAAHKLGLATRAYLPFPNMYAKWQSDYRSLFFKLVSGSHIVRVISEEFSNEAYFIRDKAMVDDADVCLAVYNDLGKGGTAITVNYNKTQGHKPMYLYNPITRIETQWGNTQ